MGVRAGGVPRKRAPSRGTDGLRKEGGAPGPDRAGYPGAVVRVFRGAAPARALFHVKHDDRICGPDVLLIGTAGSREGLLQIAPASGQNGIRRATRRGALSGAAPSRRWTGPRPRRSQPRLKSTACCPGRVDRVGRHLLEAAGQLAGWPVSARLARDRWAGLGVRDIARTVSAHLRSRADPSTACRHVVVGSGWRRHDYPPFDRAVSSTEEARRWRWSTVEAAARGSAGVRSPENGALVPDGWHCRYARAEKTRPCVVHTVRVRMECHGTAADRDAGTGFRFMDKPVAARRPAMGHANTPNIEVQGKVSCAPAVQQLSGSRSAGCLCLPAQSRPRGLRQRG